MNEFSVEASLMRTRRRKGLMSKLVGLIDCRLDFST